jgi:hypothetical protein
MHIIPYATFDYMLQSSCSCKHLSNASCIVPATGCVPITFPLFSLLALSIVQLISPNRLRCDDSG